MTDHAEQTVTVARRPSLPLHVLLALVSGAPALVYQIVWTREVALVVGSHVEAISIVLVAFFGGLALGSRWLGGVADRRSSPLKLYGALEIAAGILAIASPRLLRVAGTTLGETASPAVVALAAGALIGSITLLLGGTIPALLRSAAVDVRSTAHRAGWIMGANTVGAVAGVVGAVALVPRIGLEGSAAVAGVVAIATGAVAVAIGWRKQKRDVAAPAPLLAKPVGPGGPPPFAGGAMVVAAVGGAATLGFEVLAARSAQLWLGSSLFAWALVLGLFLTGLGAGNLLVARRAARTDRPAALLGWIETVAAIVLVLGAAWVVPDPAAAATGLTVVGGAVHAAWILPTTVMMGAAFPLFVRLGVDRPETVGAAFGRIAAANTAGGIAGAMLAPFVLLPYLGLADGLRVCAATNGLLGVVLILAGAPSGWARVVRPAIAASVLGGVAFLASRAEPLRRAPASVRLVHVSHGRQATAVVVRAGARRDLIVDGDAEASTGGDARVTEVMLGSLPMLLHRAPQSLLEIGLGAGVTLGTAARGPVADVECVEIADAVIDCAPFFAPHNGAVAAAAVGGDGGRIRIVRGDGRAHLLRRPASYDLVLANTLHPWSVGATGLYSREYFARIRRALRDGGLVAQWLPLSLVGEEHLEAILRTFYSVFAHGSVWWCADNLIIIGRPEPAGVDLRDLVFQHFRERGGPLREIGIDAPATLMARRLATAEDVRQALGDGLVLTDDRPVLEARAVLHRGVASSSAGELAVVERIARRGAERWTSVRPLRQLIASKVARAAGDLEEASRLESEAEDAGLALAREARVRRYVREGLELLQAGFLPDARRVFERALASDPADAQARFALVMIANQEQDQVTLRRELERLLRDHPDHAEGWNSLAAIEWRAGARDRARAAVARSLECDPFLPQALANAGLFAARAGDLETARAMLARLETLAPEGRDPEASTLRRTIDDHR